MGQTNSFPPECNATPEQERIIQRFLETKNNFSDKDTSPTGELSPENERAQAEFETAQERLLHCGLPDTFTSFLGARPRERYLTAKAS